MGGKKRVAHCLSELCHNIAAFSASCLVADFLLLRFSQGQFFELSKGIVSKRTPSAGQSKSHLRITTAGGLFIVSSSTPKSTICR